MYSFTHPVRYLCYRSVHFWVNLQVQPWLIVFKEQRWTENNRRFVHNISGDFLNAPQLTTLEKKNTAIISSISSMKIHSSKETNTSDSCTLMTAGNLSGFLSSSYFAAFCWWDWIWHNPIVGLQKCVLLLSFPHLQLILHTCPSFHCMLMFFLIFEGCSCVGNQ